MKASMLTVVTANSREIKRSARAAYRRDLRLVSNNADIERNGLVLSRRTRVIVMAVLAALMLGAAQLGGLHHEVAAAGPAAGPQPQAAVAAAEFEYFPAQHVNQAREPGEHIQAY